MTPEERFEKQMEFVLNQQARFYAGLERLDEKQDRLAEAQRETDQRINLQHEQISRARTPFSSGPKKSRRELQDADPLLFRPKMFKM